MLTRLYEPIIWRSLKVANQFGTASIHTPYLFVSLSFPSSLLPSSHLVINLLYSTRQCSVALRRCVPTG